MPASLAAFATSDHARSRNAGSGGGAVVPGQRYPGTKHSGKQTTSAPCRPASATADIAISTDSFGFAGTQTFARAMRTVLMPVTRVGFVLWQCRCNSSMTLPLSNREAVRTAGRRTSDHSDRAAEAGQVQCYVFRRFLSDEHRDWFSLTGNSGRRKVFVPDLLPQVRAETGSMSPKRKGSAKKKGGRSIGQPKRKGAGAYFE